MRILTKIKKYLNGVYEDDTISENNVIRRAVTRIKERPRGEDYDVANDFRHIKETVRGKRVIRVVFLFQMPEVWNKQAPLYEELCNRENFECIILAIPPYNIKTEECDRKSEDIYLYAKERYVNVYNAIAEKGWVDLEELRPDYVFYQRPYDGYLPEPYRTQNVIKYAKTCYIPYAVFDSVFGEVRMEYNRNFARAIYLHFTSNAQIVEILKKKFNYTVKQNLQRIEYHGYPHFEKVYEYIKNPQENIWDNFTNKETKFKIMWTPRWTTDPKLGGSHFFEFKDAILDYAEKNPNIFLLLRPHPLAFDNYIRQGLMTDKEVEAYLERCDKIENVRFDVEKEYLESLCGADVLISDTSSLVPEYFLTGKPLIFCETPICKNEMFQKIADSSYYVNHWEDVRKILDRLQMDDDPLKGKRVKCIDQIYGKLESVVSDIGNCIEKDFASI